MIPSSVSRSASVDHRSTAKSTDAVFGPLFMLIAKPVNLSMAFCPDATGDHHSAAAASHTALLTRSTCNVLVLMTAPSYAWALCPQSPRRLSSDAMAHKI